MRDQWVDIYLLDGRKIRAAVPRGSHQTPEVLERALQEGIVREMQRRLGGTVRSKRATAVQDTNTTKLANALRYLWKEWEQLAADPDLRIQDNPNNMVIKEASAVEPRVVRRPRLPPGYEYRVFTQTVPDGRTRSYVDIVNVEEEARRKVQLAEAQRILDVEFADNRTGIFATPTHYHKVEETGVDAEGRPKGRLVKHERPPLPPGYMYVARKDDDAAPDDAIQNRIHIERERDEEGHTTVASHISAKRLFMEAFDDATPPEKQPKIVASTRPAEGAEHTPGTTRAIIEERELVTSDAEAAAAALPREEAIVAQEPREPLAQAAPASEARVADVWESTWTGTPPDKFLDKAQGASGEPEETPPVLAVGMESTEALDLVRRTRFIYDRALNRFRMETDPERVRFVAVSPQLGFTLGYERGDKITHEEMAVYPPDMRGGISNIAIYCSIADNVILGDRMTSLLRVIAVTGKPGDILEKTYDAPIFSRISDREVSDIEIEIRTMEGRLIPFEYGVAVVTLQFRKMLYY
ncbi:Protein Y57G11C.20 [Aphelenchoides avenae]|nr:Protein Y57G11C.20 [Aphelenchus avenae]